MIPPAPAAVRHAWELVKRAPFARGCGALARTEAALVPPGWARAQSVLGWPKAAGCRSAWARELEWAPEPRLPAAVGRAERQRSAADAASSCRKRNTRRKSTRSGIPAGRQSTASCAIAAAGAAPLAEAAVAAGAPSAGVAEALGALQAR